MVFYRIVIRVVFFKFFGLCSFISENNLSIIFLMLYVFSYYIYVLLLIYFVYYRLRKNEIKDKINRKVVLFFFSF